MPERDLLAELHEAEVSHGSTLRQLDEALAAIEAEGMERRAAEVERDAYKRLLWQRGKDAADAEDEATRLRDALEHIAQSVGARANGQDAKLMARLARETLEGR